MQLARNLCLWATALTPVAIRVKILLRPDFVKSAVPNYYWVIAIVRCD